LVKENPACDELILFHVVEDDFGRYFERVRGKFAEDENVANSWLRGTGGNASYLTIPWL
jgi:hypothetical protein